MTPLVSALLSATWLACASLLFWGQWLWRIGQAFDAAVPVSFE
jgi:hypothetical protein